VHITRRSQQSSPAIVDVRPTKVERKRLVVVLACVGVYVFFYSILSWRGGYIGHNQGGSDNRDTWIPAYCGKPCTSPMGRQKVRLTVLGWLFLPPMLVDQIAVHRTHFNAE